MIVAGLNKVRGDCVIAWLWCCLLLFHGVEGSSLCCMSLSNTTDDSKRLTLHNFAVPWHCSASLDTAEVIFVS